MTTQKSQLTFPSSAFVPEQNEETAAKMQIKSIWTSFSKRFWSYTEETSTSDTSPFKGIL